jgi:hypothetical protein
MGKVFDIATATHCSSSALGNNILLEDTASLNNHCDRKSVDDTAMDSIRMKMRVENGHSLNSQTEYLICIILFLCSGSIYFKISAGISAVFEIALIFSFLLLLFEIIHKNFLLPFYQFERAAIIFCINSAIVFIVAFLNGNDNVSGYIFQKLVIYSVLIPLGYLVFSPLGIGYVENVLLRKYATVSAIFCGIGLPIWILMNVGVSLPSFVVGYQWGDAHDAAGLLGLVFPVQISDIVGFVSWYRYSLFFVEGAVAASAFLIPLGFELLLSQHPRIWVCTILIIGSICTLSTQALIFTPTLVVLWMVVSPRVRELLRSNVLLRFLGLLVIVCCVFGLPLWIIKSISDKGNVGSRSAHFNDFSAGVASLSDSPLWGHGIGNYSALQRYVSDGIAGQSSGLILTMVQGGLLLLAIAIIPFLLVILVSAYRRQTKYLLLELVILILFVNGTSDTSPMFAFFQSYSYLILFTQNEIFKMNNDAQ